LELRDLSTELFILLLKLGFGHIDHREGLSEGGEKGGLTKTGVIEAGETG
jgi:hypothetical protein